MRLSSCGVTMIGNRSRNEDAYLADDRLQVYAIADGLGGLADGHLASQAAILSVVEFLGPQLKTSDTAIDCRALLSHAVQAAHLDLVSRNSHRERAMSTTLTLALARRDTLYLAHVGDCRAYMIGDQLHRLTTDDTVSAKLAARGGPPASTNSTLSSVLTQSLGLNSTPTPQLIDVLLKVDDLLLFMSDGAYRHITDARINELRQASRSTDDFCRGFTAELNDKELDDNATCIAVMVTKS